MSLSFMSDNYRKRLSNLEFLVVVQIKWRLMLCRLWLYRVIVFLIIDFLIMKAFLEKVKQWILIFFFDLDIDF